MRAAYDGCMDVAQEDVGFSRLWEAYDKPAPVDWEAALDEGIQPSVALGIERRLSPRVMHEAGT